MSAIDWLRRRLREIGAKREEETERDSTFSYASEIHAAVYGVGLGFAFAVPNLWLTYAIVGAFLCGEFYRHVLDRTVLREIKAEPQYFIPAIVFTAVLTAATWGTL